MHWWLRPTSNDINLDQLPVEKQSETCITKRCGTLVYRSKDDMNGEEELRLGQEDKRTRGAQKAKRYYFHRTTSISTNERPG